jgi:two-component system response regulator HydG
MDEQRKVILIVDANDASLYAISRGLEKSGYRIFTAQDCHSAIQILDTNEINVIVTALKLPDKSGYVILDAAKKKDAAIIVIFVTSSGTIESAVEAMQKGAHYFLKKPISINELRVHIERGLEKQELEYKVEDLSRKLESKHNFDGLIGVSDAIHKVFEQIRQVAPTKSTVLIQGESGTGKELIARSIHQNSNRKEKPFLAINCSAISSNLLESELFGHEKGAFTGATTTHKGYFEVADTGTIFLDEIGDMAQMTQAKILRVLEEREFLRVGGTSPIRTDIRIITATNINLEKAVAEKRFREDLYYRLKVFSIRVPPLKARKEDLPYFVNYFLNKYRKENSRSNLRISKDAMRRILAYDWPGNVRELRNFLERASITARNGKIGLRELTTSIRNCRPVEQTSMPQNDVLEVRVGETLEQIEARAIRQTLQYTKGNKTQAARILKIGIRTLQRKVKKYNL